MAGIMPTQPSTETLPEPGFAFLPTETFRAYSRYGSMANTTAQNGETSYAHALPSRLCPDPVPVSACRVRRSEPLVPAIAATMGWSGCRARFQRAAFTVPLPRADVGRFACSRSYCAPHA